MPHAALPPSFFPHPVRIAALLLALLAGTAHADDYSAVNALLQQGKADAALRQADAYIASKPRDPQMRFLRGVILTEQGKPADAIANYEALTQEFPELAEPFNNLAALYAAQSQFGKARAALEMAIKLNPEYATAHENLGDIYARLAAQSYSLALKLESGNTSVPPKLAHIRQLFISTTDVPAPAPAPAPAATPTAEPEPISN